MLRRLWKMLTEPEEFFESVRTEGAREALRFLVQVSALLAVITPIANYLGWPSTDLTSTYQAQILAYRLTIEKLLPRLGAWAYAAEAVLILALAVALALFMTLFVHLIYRAIGGQGPVLNAWKAVCYGTGPCVILGWAPYWTLFMGAWSLVLQMYYAPKLLYRAREGRALAVLGFLIGATLLEFATKGTTVGF